MSAQHSEDVIRTLLHEANASAIECVVTLIGGNVSIQGSLSISPQGGLRMLAPDPSATQGYRPQGIPVPMMEHFFDYADVIVVSVKRAVTVEQPRIVRA